MLCKVSGHSRCRILTENFDLIVLQRLSGLIGGHAGVPPGVLLLSVENLQGATTWVKGIMKLQMSFFVIFSVKFCLICEFHIGKT